MNSALPHASADDPRLAPIVSASLRRARLDPEWGGTVRQLMTGEMSPRTLRCCGSGCRPCVQDLLSCTVSALRAYHDPALEQQLMEEKGLKGRARRLAGKLADRALRRVRFPNR